VLVGYLQAIARRWYILVALIVVALLVLVGALKYLQQAEARVIVPSPSQSTNANFQNVATSYVVANQVVHDLNLKQYTPTSLLNKVTVAQEYGSDVYDISVRSSNGPEAIKIAQKWAEDTMALYSELNTEAASQSFAKAQQQLSQAEATVLQDQQKLVAFEYQHPELANPVTTSTTTGNTSTSGSTTTSTFGSTSGSATTPPTTSTRTDVQTASTPGAGISQGSTTTSTIVNPGFTSETSSTATQNGTSTINQSQTTTGKTTTSTDNTPGNVTDAQALATLKQQFADATAIYDQLSQVIGNQQNFAINNDTQATAVLLDPARIPPPNWFLLIPFTVLLALLLGIGVIFAVEYFDQRMFNPDQVEKLLGAPVIVAAPLKKSKGQRQLTGAAAGWRPGLPEPDRSMYWRDNG